LNTIEPFQDLAKSRFDAIYRTIIARFLSKDEIVYLEGNPAECLHLIFQGGFKLKKRDFGMIKRADNLEELVETDVSKSKLHTILNLDKGDFSGFEALENIQYPKYKYSLFANDEHNIIMSINIKSIGNEMKDKLQNCLRSLIIQKEKILTDIESKHLMLKNKMRLTFREDVMNKMAKGKKTDGLISSMCDTLRLTSLENSSCKKDTQNEFKNFKIKISKNMSTISTNTSSKVNFPNNKNQALKTLTSSTSRRNSPKKVQLSFMKNIILPSSEINSGGNSPRMTLQSLRTFKHQISHFTLNQQSDIKSPRLTSTYAINEDIPIKNRLASHGDIRPIFESNLMSGSTERYNTFITGNKTKALRSLLKNLVNKQQLESCEHYSKYYIDKFVTKSCTKWKNLKRSRSNDYNSGNFEMPLITKLRINEGL
jgi:hypothetical protein